MKKLMYVIMAVCSFGLANAQEKTDNSQDQTNKGKWLIEANTGFGNGLGSTSMDVKTINGKTSYNIGAEGGYFIMKNLALKVGLGFGGAPLGINNYETDRSETSYINAAAIKLGAKYYILNKFPVELSCTAQSDSAPYRKFGSYISSSVGIQAGYALFLGKNISIEPGIRYNKSISNSTDNLELNVGFALHF